ncbi:MAG TPA: hypothetical protein VHR97_11180 [Candidatus Baltobacteraceae bacterium]|jgi:hypothetical protein|nr:hypothetical protein [Candidatus Baltobacteraceae bacterium]
MTGEHREFGIMAGPREHRLRLPIESRVEITVRPAYRPPEDQPSWLESVTERWFDIAGRSVFALAMVMLVGLVTVQIYLHFHSGSALP